MRPGLGLTREPGHALARPVRHVEDVGDGVHPPGIVGSAQHGVAAPRLGGPVIARFLEGEGVAALNVGMARMVRIVAVDHRLDGAAHAGGVADHEADRVTELQREGIAGRGAQRSVQDRGGALQIAGQIGVERVQIGPLTRRRAGGHDPRGLVPGLARRFDQLPPAQQQQEIGLGRMGEGEVGGQLQRAGQVLGCRGGMGEEGVDRRTPWLERFGRVERDVVSEHVLLGHLAAPLSFVRRMGRRQAGPKARLLPFA